METILKDLEKELRLTFIKYIERVEGENPVDELKINGELYSLMGTIHYRIGLLRK